MLRVLCMYHSPLAGADSAIAKSRNSAPAKGEARQLERVIRVGNRLQHGSVLEHLVYTFDIEGVSRALLQELARHRIASLTVKSTRYTLQELKEEDPFNYPEDRFRASKYVRLTKDNKANKAIINGLQNLWELVQEDVKNDIAKYALPESYLTEMVWTINARSLQNFLRLRTNPSALEEIRELAQEVYEALPETHQPIFKEVMYAKVD